MAAIGEKEIKALIRSGDIGGAFLLFGTESYLKEFYSSKLKDKAVSPDFADFNYHFFDGASCTLEDHTRGCGKIGNKIRRDRDK